jgi:uncharacterized protein YdeI (YjbR/CyaY-like superfamily)
MELLPEFSHPLAEQVRSWILRWEPDLTESIKWNMLCFSGRKLVCGVSACQKHLGISFFRGTELLPAYGLFHEGANNTSIQSIRMTTLEGFNAKAFKELLHAAVHLDGRPDLPPPPPAKREPLPMPAILAEALKKNRAAAAAFATLKPTYQREYIVWVGMAKLPETQNKRLKQTLAALAAGKKWAQRKEVQ